VVFYKFFTLENKTYRYMYLFYLFSKSLGFFFWKISCRDFGAYFKNFRRSKPPSISKWKLFSRSDTIRI